MKIKKWTKESFQAWLDENMLKIQVIEFNGFKEKSLLSHDQYGNWYKSVKQSLSDMKRRGFLSHPSTGTLRLKQTMLAKYGVENPSQLPDYKEKIKKTSLERYGVDNPAKSPEIQKKIKQTNLEKYGTECVFENKVIKQQICATNLEKYGHEHALSSPDIKQKAKDAYFLKHGVEHVKDIPGSTEKAKKTNLEKYGAECTLDRPGIREKIKQDCLEQHGVEYFCQTSEFKEMAKKTNLEKYGVENVFHSKDFQNAAFLTKQNNGQTRRSKAEIEILEFCKATIDPNTSSTIVSNKERNFQIDIKIPSKNICIEFNGSYWHSEANAKIYPRYHLEKTLACQSQGLRLVHIWEHEWKDKKPQVLSYIKSISGIFERRVFARKTTCMLVDTITANEFLENNHLLGKVKHLQAYGLFFNEELVGLATLGRHHRKSGILVLSRMSFKSGVQIIGGMSKLSQIILIESSSDQIITWADKRLGALGGYLKSGWSIEEEMPPDYFYWDGKNKKAVSKQSRRKSTVGTPEGMTEHEHALQDKLYRIYDCGKIRLVLKKP